MATLNDDIASLKRSARDLQEDEPQRFPTEEEVAKGKDESEPFDISKDPKPWELRQALGVTRSEIGFALDSAWSAIEELRDMLDDLKKHRHDTTKNFCGRPEY